MKKFTAMLLAAFCSGTIAFAEAEESIKELMDVMLVNQIQSIINLDSDTQMGVALENPVVLGMDAVAQASCQEQGRASMQKLTKEYFAVDDSVIIENKISFEGTEISVQGIFGFEQSKSLVNLCYDEERMVIALDLKFTDLEEESSDETLDQMEVGETNVHATQLFLL